VLGFFNLCICIYICTGLYIDMIVSLDFDTVVHFIKKIIFLLKNKSRKIFLLISN